MKQGLPQPRLVDKRTIRQSFLLPLQQVFLKGKIIHNGTLQASLYQHIRAVTLHMIKQGILPKIYKKKRLLDK